MGLPTISGTGRLTATPELRFYQGGVAVCSLNLAFNSRRLDKASGNWVDGDVFYVRATAFKDLAEHIVESLDKGDEVNVIGRLKTDEWEKDGQKRSAPSLIIDSIGPNLRFVTTRSSKADRGGGKSASADDPWGSAPPAGSGSFADEPPFHHPRVMDAYNG